MSIGIYLSHCITICIFIIHSCENDNKKNNQEAILFQCWNLPCGKPRSVIQTQLNNTKEGVKKGRDMTSPIGNKYVLAVELTMTVLPYLQCSSSASRERQHLFLQAGMSAKYILLAE